MIRLVESESRRLGSLDEIATFVSFSSKVDLGCSTDVATSSATELALSILAELSIDCC